VVSALTPACQGDPLAAEYLLLLLTSRVFTRQEESPGFSTAIGIVPLQLANAGDQTASAVADVLAQLMPRVVGAEISPSFLTKHRFQPRKDYERNRLLAGALQLAPGTVLVLDETPCTEGKLAAEALQGLRALRVLLERQLLALDFGQDLGYNVHFQTEIPAVSVTRKVKSLLADVNFATVVLPTAASAAAGLAPSAAGDWTPLRRYLAAVRRHTAPLVVAEDVQDLVQTTFVGARKADPLVKQESFSLWMTLARSLVASYGETDLTVTRWAEVMRMEETRRKRLRA